jgi:hypothetical protein
MSSPFSSTTASLHHRLTGKLMTALGTTNKLTLTSRLGTPFTAGNPGIGLAEPEPTLGALDNVFELHLHEPFFWRSFIKITGIAVVPNV